MFSRRKAILITSRMVALSSMKITVGVLAILDLSLQQAGALVEFTQRIEHQLGGRAQHRAGRGAGAWDKFVNPVLDSIRALDDLYHGIVSDPVPGLGVGDVAGVEEDDP